MRLLAGGLDLRFGRAVFDPGGLRPAAPIAPSRRERLRRRPPPSLRRYEAAFDRGQGPGGRLLPEHLLVGHVP